MSIARWLCFRRCWTVGLAVVTAEVDLASGHAQSAMERLRPLVESAWTALELRLLRGAGAAPHLVTPRREWKSASLREKSENPALVAQAWLITALAAEPPSKRSPRLVRARSRLDGRGTENLRRPFVALSDRRLEAMPEHHLTLEAAGGHDTRGFAAMILEQLGPGDRVTLVSAPLAEPLTDREQVVLSHMPTLQHERGEEGPYASVNTVKAHARAVYRKLEVRNRREAVNRARQLGLI